MFRHRILSCVGEKPVMWWQQRFPIPGLAKSFLMEQRCLSSCHLRPSESVSPYSSASGHCSGKCSCSLYEALFHRDFLKAQDRTTEDNSERAIPFQDLNLPNSFSHGGYYWAVYFLWIVSAQWFSLLPCGAWEQNRGTAWLCLTLWPRMSDLSSWGLPFLRIRAAWEWLRGEVWKTGKNAWPRDAKSQYHFITSLWLLLLFATCFTFRKKYFVIWAAW